MWAKDRTPGRVPDLAFYDLTWGIPRNYGGMTSVLLHRSGTFGEYLDKPVEILTLDPALDVTQENQRLREAGALGSKSTIRGLWQELLAADDDELRAWFGEPLEPEERWSPADLPTPPGTPTGMGRTEWRDGSTVSVVRFDRPDGSIAVLDDRREGRVITVFSHEGRILARYKRMRNFYFAWFDHLMGATPAVLINESKTVGAWVHSYRRRNVLLCQVLHNSHLEPGATSLYGPFTPSRIKMLENNEAFDLLAFLTQQQKSEFEVAFGEEPNRVVLPNSRAFTSLPAADADTRRRGSGIVLASLDARKRVDHAIEAVAGVVGSAGEQVTLDIFGEGRLRGDLEEMVSRLGLESAVHVRGYTTNVQAQLRDHSFLMLSSRAEGMGLVLVEAMAQGCIPIAYDVRYGPSDIIEHGRNGFLVPDGEPLALSAAVDHFLGLPEEEVAALRSAAVARARDFDDARIAQAWKQAIDTAWKHKEAAEPEPPKPQLVRVEQERENAGGTAYTVVLHEDPAQPITAELVADVVSEGHRYGLRVVAKRCDSAAPATYRFVVPAGVLPDSAEGSCAVYVRFRGSRLQRRIKVGTVSVGSE